MTVTPFPQRLSDKLRLAAHAAYAEGDTSLAERLLCVLRRYVTSPSRPPAEMDRRQPQGPIPHEDRFASLHASNDS